MENFKDITIDKIPWLTSDIIAGDSSTESNDSHNIHAFTKASDAVGAFVEVQVQGVVHQLQRVISRCSCEFMYVNLDDEIDPLAEEYVPSFPSVSKFFYLLLSLLILKIYVIYFIKLKLFFVFNIIFFNFIILL